MIETLEPTMACSAKQTWMARSPCQKFDRCWLAVWQNIGLGRQIHGGRREWEAKSVESTMIEFLEPIPSQCPGHPGHVKVISVIPAALEALADSVKQGRVNYHHQC